MKKILINMMLCLCAIGMNAQTLKQQGNAVEQIVPEGWEHEEEEGDLNKDGIKDLVVLAKPNFKENMKTRDDGYEYNFNPYILAIYFGQAETDAIVTLGMAPTRPETGYGYIQADLQEPSLRNKEIFRVDSFKEKPDYKTAVQYLKKRDFFWNSGIFIWNVGTIVNSLRIYEPEISKIFEDLLPYYGTEKEQELIDKVFPECPSISIDYAVMERADEIFVFPADFGWSDVGTWGSLHALAPVDKQGNNVIGENVKLYETKNCVVHTTEEKRVVIQGLDGYIVAEKDNTLLICKLEEEQRIKEFSAE